MHKILIWDGGVGLDGGGGSVVLKIKTLREIARP
mgnify:CR=1 FL=1